jgi:hypothetical protein
MERSVEDVNRELKLMRDRLVRYEMVASVTADRDKDLRSSQSTLMRPGIQENNLFYPHRNSPDTVPINAPLFAASKNSPESDQSANFILDSSESTIEDLNEIMAALLPQSSKRVEARLHSFIGSNFSK